MNKNVIKFSISKNISKEPFRPISRPFTKQLGELDEVTWSKSILPHCNTVTATNPRSYKQKKMISIKPFTREVRQRLLAKMSGSCPSKLDGGEISPLPSGI